MKGKKAKKQSNQTISTLQNIWQSPKGKALFFFGFYFFFFLFIGVSYRSAMKNPASKTTLPAISNESSKTVSLDEITKGNYHFTYYENINGVEKNLEGKSYDKMKNFTSSTAQEYFIYSGLSLIHQNNVWQISENPFDVPEVMKEELIEELLSKATFISKTVYKENTALYHYEVSTTTLYQLYYNENIDIADDANTIDIEVSKEGKISQITYDYSPYLTYKNKVPTTLLIKVSYQDYGKIEAFEVPD